MEPDLDNVYDDPEYREECRQLSDSEKAKLEQQVTRDGFKDSIKVWLDPDDGKFSIVDGYNRWDIWNGDGLPDNADPPTFDVVCRGQSREEVKQWIRDNQLGRRNLTDAEYSYMLGKEYNDAKKAKEETLVPGPKSSMGENAPTKKTREKTPKRTRDAIAEKHGETPSKVRRSGEFATAVDTIENNVSPKAARDIRDGKIAVSQNDVIAISNLPKDQQAKAISKARMGELDLNSFAKFEDNGEQIPEKVKPAAAIGKRLGGIIHNISQLVNEAIELSKQPGGEFIQATQLKLDVGQLNAVLKAGRFRRVCQTCKAKGRCKYCNSRGWVTYEQWDGQKGKK